MADVTKTQIATLIGGIKADKKTILDKLIALTVPGITATSKLHDIATELEKVELVTIGTQSLAVGGQGITIKEGYTKGGTITISTQVEDKTVTPSATEDVVVSSTGDKLLGSVTVKKVELPENIADKLLAGEQITSNGTILAEGTIPSKAATTIFPSTANQVINDGQYLSGKLTIAGVAVSDSLKAENVVAGTTVTIGDAEHPTSIAEVTGTFTAASTVSEGLVAATAADMLEGTSAWVNGAEVKGSITKKAAATYVTSTQDQTIAAGQYLEGALTIKAVQTTNIDAANIKHGVNVKVGDASDSGRIASVTGEFYNDGTTYTLSEVGETIDMGATSSHRYITTSGLQLEATGNVIVDKAYPTEPLNVKDKAGVIVPEGSVTTNQGTLTVVDGVDNDVFTQGNIVVTSGWVNAQSIEGATFANVATAETTYKDISDSTASPVLISDDYLYVNAGYTDNVKISLAKLVPNEANITKATGADYVLKGKTAYDKDGMLITGTIESHTTTTYYPSADDLTISAGKYIGADITINKVTHNVDATKIPAGTTVKMGDTTNDSRIASVAGTFGNDADATAANILSGKVAYSLVDGSLVAVTGTAANKSGEAGDLTINCLAVELNGTDGGQIIPAGYYDGSSKVRLTDDIITELEAI